MTWTKNTTDTSAVYGNVAVAVTATLIRAANTTRSNIHIRNNGAATVFLGTDTSVTTANGYALPAGGEFTDEWWPGAIYGIVASGTVDVRYFTTA